MKIARDPASRLWTLTQGNHVLYAGRKSPWNDPELIRAALRRERTMAPNRSGLDRGPRSGVAH